MRVRRLGDLRWVLDAERHRIRRKLIRVRHEISQREHGHGDRQRFCGNGRNDLVAEALAIIALARSLFVMFGLPLPFTMGTALAKNLEPVSRENEQGHDGDE